MYALVLCVWFLQFSRWRFLSSLWYGVCLFRAALFGQYIFAISSRSPGLTSSTSMGSRHWKGRWCSLMHSVVPTFGLDIPSRVKSVCFWIWHDYIWINCSHTTCCMHLGNKKWNEVLQKHLHSVSLELFAAIRMGTFVNLIKISRLLLVLLCPRCIHSPKIILLFDWQHLWVNFIIISDCLWAHFIGNLCCSEELFFSSPQLVIFLFAQVISKGIVSKENSSDIMGKWGYMSLHCAKCSDTWCVYSMQKDIQVQPFENWYCSG